MGRPRKKGNRSPSGRKRKPTTTEGRTRIDKGNAKIAKRIEYFNGQVFAGGGQGHRSCCPVGLLALTGNLEGHDASPSEMYDVFSLYMEQRELAGFAPVGARSQAFERADRSSGDTPDSKLFWTMELALKRRLGNAGMTRRRMFDSLIHDRGPFGDAELDCPMWVRRFVTAFQHSKGLIAEPPHYELPGQIDRDRLEAVTDGLCALVDMMAGKKDRGEIALWKLRAA